MHKSTTSRAESSMAIEDTTMELHPHPEKRSKPNLPPQQIRQLPPEIITVILSRLPVKSLLQFRSVSKSWRSIISDPKFIKTHLNISSKNDEIPHHKLIFWSFSLSGQTTIKNCHLSPVLNNGFSVNPTELDYFMKQHPHACAWIVGSINGLISIATSGNETFLWNPATRISKKLPHSGVKLTYYSTYGFGYDESTDDYRVVGIFGDIGSEDSHIVMVYSLRTDCWRRIGDFPSGSKPLGDSGKFLNGAIHWAAHGLNLPYSKSIVSLHLAKETYDEVAQPRYGEGEFEMSLDVVGECLFVLCDYRGSGSHVDVWMMKEYGVRESWMKLACIPYACAPSTFVFPVLLHISKNGELLLKMDSRIVLYNPKITSVRNPDIRNIYGCLEANAYIESLVSPLIQEGQEKHQ